MAEKMPPKTDVLELPLGTTSKCCSFQILGPFSDELGMGFMLPAGGFQKPQSWSGGIFSSRLCILSLPSPQKHQREKMR